MKEKNLEGLTPLQKLLKMSFNNSNTATTTLRRLFEHKLIDLEKRDTFEGIEDDVIEGFANKAIDHHSDLKTSGKKFIDSKSFFDAFKD